MRCLVTGAAGFVGSHLSEKLVSNGHEVIGIDCFTDYYEKDKKLSNLRILQENKNFKLIEADLNSYPLSEILFDIDYVFHLAAQPGVRKSWGTDFAYYVRDNVSATQRLLEAAKECSSIRKVIYSSSSSIYGDSERFPTPEGTIPKPNSPYGVTKLTAENLCNVYFKNYGVPAVALRFFTVYGPRQRPDMAFNRFISKISKGDEIEVYGDGSQARDFTFYSDTIKGIVLALNAKPGSIFNVGSGKTVTLNQAISIMEELIGKKAKIAYGNKAAGDVERTSADISKIKNELGYSPSVELEDGLEKQVVWQKSLNC
jgi:nucleoside-diphosphate-sugar epimerase